MGYVQKIVEAIATRSVEGIKECLAHRVDPNDHHKGELLIYELTNEYARGRDLKNA